MSLGETASQLLFSCLFRLSWCSPSGTLDDFAPVSVAAVFTTCYKTLMSLLVLSHSSRCWITDLVLDTQEEPQ